MLLTDITKIIRVLLGAFETVASQDDLTQRRIDQIGQVIGAVGPLTGVPSIRTRLPFDSISSCWR